GGGGAARAPGATRATLFASRNQSRPSGPFVIVPGCAPAEGSANSVTTPDGVILPSRLPANSVNHKFPSTPTVMQNGWAPTNERPNSVMTPAVVIRPIGPAASVNQSAPSGPLTIPRSCTFPVKTNSVMAPVVVIRPILLGS